VQSVKVLVSEQNLQNQNEDNKNECSHNLVSVTHKVYGYNVQKISL
jgi:hypothetical protein